MTKIRSSHLGFVITFSEDRPITGRWRGVRYGVSVCSGTYDSLIQVIKERADILLDKEQQ